MFFFAYATLVERWLAAWVLATMLHLQPHAPWLSTYERTADAIAAASRSQREAATLIALAFYESNFDPNARGDNGASLGLFQIQKATAGASEDELLEPERAAKHAVRLVHASARVCSERPKDEALVWYASGGHGCSSNGDAVRKAKHRFALAERLVR